MRRYKTVLSALSILFLTASAQATPWKIQPGVGVGPVLINGDSKTADAAFNRKEVLTTHGGTGRWINYKEGLELELESGKILQIVVPEPSLSSKQGSLEFELDGGIRVGSTVAQMETALGKNYQTQDLKVASTQAAETYYAYVSRGIGFMVRQGKIFRIMVWPKK